MSRSPLVLVVEDDEDLRSLLVSILAEEEFDTHGTANGVLALHFLHAHPETACILLDLMMPIMSGWQFRAAQLADPSIAHIPVIVLSAIPPESGKLDVLDADAFLPKPHDLDRLFAVVRACLQPQQALEEEAPVKSDHELELLRAQVAEQGLVIGRLETDLAKIKVLTGKRERLLHEFTLRLAEMLSQLESEDATDTRIT